MSKQLSRVNFELIRYANCWEDAEILLKGLKVKPGSKVLSIASGGDNSLSLLTTGAEKVIAVDLSIAQLRLVELKKEAIRTYGQPQYREFMGFTPTPFRRKLYHILRKNLSPETQAYWDRHYALIQKGLIYQGKFEKYFRLFALRILPFIHSKKKVRQVFVAKSEEEQQHFYQEHWNTARWRLFFKVFFGKWVMGRLGRDPEFFRQVDIPVSQYIFQMAERELSSAKAQENHFLYFTLNGHFQGRSPHYLREENYNLIRKNIDRLHLFEGLAEDALKAHPNIDYLNLSDIFEYMDPELFRQVGQKLLDLSAPKARMAYWNLMVPRELSEIFPERIKKDVKASEDLSVSDKGFFYRKFIIDQKS